MFAGTDSLGVGRTLKLIHIGDKLALIDPERLPGRLSAAGLSSGRRARRPSVRFRPSARSDLHR